MRRPFSNIIRDGTRWRFLVADRSRKPAKKMTNLPLERQKKCEEFSRGQKPRVPVSLPPRCIVSSSWPINSLVTWWAIFRRHCLTRRSTRNFVWSKQYDYIWEILYRCSLSLDSELLCNITFLGEMQIAIFIKYYNKYSTLNILYRFAYYVTIFASLGLRVNISRLLRKTRFVKLTRNGNVQLSESPSYHIRSSLISFEQQSTFVLE